MKIKMEGEKLVKAVRKLDGIEIMLEDSNDAKEAINLVLRKSELFQREDFEKLRDVNVTSLQEYKTSAVDYKLSFLLDFLFDEDTPLDNRVTIIKDLQEFFNKA